MKNFSTLLIILLVIAGKPVISQGIGDYGDAPEGVLAYPDNGVIGQFPTCLSVLPGGSIRHNNFGAWLGPGFDFEPDGNAGMCPVFNPNMYNMDECQNDGDAGLLICGAFTITGMPGAESYVPCGPGLTNSIGTVCMPIIVGQHFDLIIHNTMPNGTIGYLNILFDWNRDGIWAGNDICQQGQVQLVVPEHRLINLPVPPGFIGLLSNLIPGTAFMCGSSPGYIWTRITITEAPVFIPWDGSGNFEDGETEDYLVHLASGQSIQLDWGDAPDPGFPVLQASNGANHQIVPGIFLGNTVDAESDGQPGITALNDDNQNTDDEDGVMVRWGLLSGSPGNVEVQASVPGFLDAWADFNADGDWNDPGEQIFTSTPLIPGLNRLSFLIPLLQVQTDTYIRYRFSQQGGLAVTGPAPDGEVEDYFEVIASNSQYKWKQDPDNGLPGLHCHDALVNQSYQQIYIADDWVCNGGQVTSILWYGAYENPGSGIRGFNISVMADNPQTCQPIPNIPPSINPFFDVFVNISGLNETPTGVLNNSGQMIYVYTYTLSVPLAQIPGNRYWLGLSSVSNDSLNPSLWKWQEASRSRVPALCPAVTKTIINGVQPPWTPIAFANGSFSEMAFQIMNIPATPVMPVNLFLQAGDWIEAEPWHNWFGGNPGTKIPVRLFAYDSLDKIQMVQFFYSADSLNWTSTGIDNNPQESPVANGTSDTLTPGDGWAVYVPVEQFTAVYPNPTPLHFKAEIELISGEILEYVKPTTVYFDPTPASSFEVSISDWYSTFKDTLEFTTVSGLANASIWSYKIEPKKPYFYKGVPNASQRNPSFPGLGNFFCAPTATAACFKYFEGKGDDSLCGGLGMNSLILKLAEKFKTWENKGTYFGPWSSGIREWIKAHGDKYSIRTYSFWQKDANGNDIYTFSPYWWRFMRNELEHKQDVLVDWAWFDQTGWKGSHAVTFNSVLNKPLPNGKYQVDFMDPWTNKKEFGELDPANGTVTSYANSTGYANLSAKITNLIIICPKEPSSVPAGGSGGGSGPNPPPGKIRILLPGPNFLRIYCVDEDGFQYRKDIVFEWFPTDFGDAPDSYQTLFSSDGPRHPIDTLTYLGDTVDYDNDGLPSLLADGDDNLNIDDEDGVSFSTPLFVNDTIQVQVQVSVAGAFLQGWIDFNQNGTFESPTEQILTDALTIAGTNIFNINTPQNALPGNTYARFRLSTQPGLVSFGPAPDGEVEDYRITFYADTLGIIMGSVYYLNDVLSPVSNAEIILSADQIPQDTVLTDTNGSFQFEVPDNTTYQLTASADKPWGGVNSTDALQILKHFVNIISLDGLYETAADVDNSGAINSIDALLTARRFTGIVTSFAAGDWAFTAPEVVVGAAGLYTSEVQALCYGDVNGSYVPALKEEPAINNQISTPVAWAPEMKLEIRTGQELWLGAISLVLELPSGYTTMAVEHGSPAATEPLLFHQTGNELRISWYSMNPGIYAVNDVLVVLYLHSDFCSDASLNVLPGSTLANPDGIEYEGVDLQFPGITEQASDSFFFRFLPNPFSGTGAFSFSLEKAGIINLQLMNTLGECVINLCENEYRQYGHYSVPFDCSGCRPGMYTARLEWKNGNTLIRKNLKVILIRQK